MASGAFNTFGTLLQMDDGLGNYTTIAEARDINGFGYATAEHDVTSHSSPSGYEEILPSAVKRSKALTVPVIMLPADGTHNFTTGYLKNWRDTIRRSWKIVIPGSLTWTFLAFVTEFTENFPVDGPGMGDFHLKPTGAPTLA